MMDLTQTTTADDLAPRITDLVTLLQQAQQRARARQAEPPSVARRACYVAKSALGIAHRSMQRWQAAEDDPRLPTKDVDARRQTAWEDLNSLMRALEQWQQCEPRPLVKQQVQDYLNSLAGAVEEAWEADYGG